MIYVELSFIIYISNMILSLAIRMLKSNFAFHKQYRWRGHKADIWFRTSGVPPDQKNVVFKNVKLKLKVMIC